MILKKYNTGLLDVNTYLLIDEPSKEAIIIDLGGNFSEINNEISKNNAKLKFILHTHGHFDHVMGDYEAQQTVNAEVYVHKADEFMVTNLPEVMEQWNMPPAQAPKITGFIDEKSNLSIGNQTIKVIETPGHSQGGVSFLIGDLLFSGDTLFNEAVGRTDLPGGDFKTLENSIRNKLFTLSDDVKVYPGHGRESTIGWEKEHNQFL